ncbi:hypothetical protein J1614_010924 [Plenodomus biglobosus]|nr:hypothetical protein J1614_010924 [Plenodomus biglobosus]
MVQLSQALLTTLFLASSVIAHPGGNINKEILRRQAHLDHPNRRNVYSCKRDLVESGWVREQHRRRETRLHELRVAAGFAKPHELVRRDVTEIEENYGVEAACTLDPESSEGPYWVAGELIRQDLLTGEKGAITHLDVNVIDTSTCKPVPNAYVELWSTNATGVYLGVQGRINGDGSDSAMTSNALRGLQPTNENGTATFITLVPGHYYGRTNHIHIMIHHNPTLLPNSTLTPTQILHVGQLYLPPPFLSTLQSHSPYNTNTQPRLSNEQDPLYALAASGGDDPLLKVSLLGGGIEEGLFAVADVGVDLGARREPVPVAVWREGGSVPVPGSPWEGYPGGGRPEGGEAGGEVEEVQEEG